MKGLLGSMPPVTKRVEEMRAGRAPGLQAKQAQVEVDQSQVAACCHARQCWVHPAVLILWFWKS